MSLYGICHILHWAYESWRRLLAWFILLLALVTKVFSWMSVPTYRRIRSYKKNSDPCVPYYENPCSESQASHVFFPPCRKQKFIGNVKFSHVESGTSKRFIFVATEANVLAGLGARTGQIAWRQVYKPGPGGNIDALLCNNEGKAKWPCIFHLYIFFAGLSKFYICDAWQQKVPYVGQTYFEILSKIACKI